MVEAAHDPAVGMVVNRTQALVFGFMLLAWIALVSILIGAPYVYDQTLKLPPGDRRSGELVFLALISAVIALLGIGVVRRWRWTFWLIVIAFVLGGMLRVPATILELAGILPAQGPAWYALLQGVIGVIQFLIGLAMLAGYRRAGLWGAF